MDVDDELALVNAAQNQLEDGTGELQSWLQDLPGTRLPAEPRLTSESRALLSRRPQLPLASPL